MWIKYNPNPVSSHVGDCVIRALSLALNYTWDRVYMELCAQGYVMKDMPSSNSVWGTYLLMHGFKREAITDSCPDCYTVKDFCRDHKSGLYLLCTGSHVVAVVDGHYKEDVSKILSALEVRNDYVTNEEFEDRVMRLIQEKMTSTRQKKSAVKDEA